MNYFIGSLSPGGAERQMVYTAGGVSDKGFEVFVTCQNLRNKHNDFYAGTLRERGIPVEELPEIDSLSDFSVENSDVFSKAVGKIKSGLRNLRVRYFEEQVIRYMIAILKTRPEIVHTWLDEINIEAGIAALIMGVPKIIMGQRNVSPYHFGFYQPFMRPGYKFVAQDPRVIFLNNSKGGMRDYVKWIGLPKNRIEVLYNGYPVISETPSIDQISNFKKSMGIPLRVPVVGSVFRFYDEKRPLLWLKTAKEILRSRPETRFLLVGDGVLKKKMLRNIVKLGLKDRVIFSGVLKNPYLAMSAMDVFLLTSRCEGLPNVLIEAQGLGVPVVTTDVGGTSEAIDPDVTGFVVERAMPELLSRKVLEVLDNFSWRSRVKEIAPEYVKRKFNIEDMINQTLNIYGLTH